KLGEVVVAQAVEPRIAGPEADSDTTAEYQRHQGAAHGGLIEHHIGVVENVAVYFQHRLFHHIAEVAKAIGAFHHRQPLNDHATGHVAHFVAAHSVGDGPQPYILTLDQRVFINFSHRTHIGAGAAAPVDGAAKSSIMQGVAVQVGLPITRQAPAVAPAQTNPSLPTSRPT